MAEKNRSWKRVIAGLLALTLVVGNVPANVGVGGLFGSSSIVASAETITLDETFPTTWSAGTYTISENYRSIDSKITMTGDVTLEIPEGSTLIIGQGIDAGTHTLTVTGKGALIVYGYGKDGNAGVTGNVIVNGAYVEIYGGNAIDGEGGMNNGLVGGNGGKGGNGVNGNFTIYSGYAEITGRAGGYGGYGEEIGGDGGDGGYGVAGDIDILGGTVIIYGGEGGIGGSAVGNNGNPGATATAYLGTMTLGKDVKLYDGDEANEDKILDGNDSENRTYNGNMKQVLYATGPAAQIADKTALNDAITEAENYYNSIKDNPYYVEIKAPLKTEIENAKTVANSNAADQDAVDAATTAITTAKTTAEAARKDVDDTRAANDVIYEIDALPASNEVKTSDKAAIEAARKAYDALTTKQKEMVDADTRKKLEDAETALTAAEKAAEKEAADKAASTLNDLPATNDITTADKAAIEAARKAYDALTDEQKAKVAPETLKKLEDAEKALAAAEKEAADKAAAEKATSTFNDLPATNDITTADKAEIEAARKAYDALTDEQKAKVAPETLKKLEDAEKALAAAEKEAADKAAAEKATSTLNDLPATNDITTADKAAIEAARKAYDSLTDDQKAKVSPETLKKLEEAEKALEAEDVKEQVNDLPEANDITAENKDAIEAVRKAFDKLTPEQLARIPAATQIKLAQAEKALADVEKADALEAKEKAEQAQKTAEDKQKAAEEALEKGLADAAEKVKAAEQAKADAEKAKKEADAAVASMVSDVLDALPDAKDITKDSASDVEAARKAYDKLNDAQKALVNPDALQKLTDAEKAVAALNDDEKIVKGDASGDGKVDVTDIAMIASHIKGIRPLSENGFKAADVNGDGKVDVTDIALVASHIKGIKALK